MRLMSNLNANSAHHDAEMKLRGGMGRINKFTVPQVQDLMDQRHQKEAKKLQARRHFLDLQKQLQDKKMREESQRIYLD